MLTVASRKKVTIMTFRISEVTYLKTISYLHLDCQDFCLDGISMLFSCKPYESTTIFIITNSLFTKVTLQQKELTYHIHILHGKQISQKKPKNHKKCDNIAF